MSDGETRLPWRKNPSLWCFVFFAIAVTLSLHRSSFQAEFCDFPDESPHYVTGLMVRDYIASGASTPPMRYAENYYHHYPKVALGHWPPVFYVVEAFWMLIFSVSRWSVLLLMCAQAAALALLLQKAISRDLPEVYGIFAGLFLLSLPLVQRLSSTVMSELLVAGLVFAATLRFADYLESPDSRRAVAFGLLACLAVLTKGTGFVLALVPPISVLLTRRFDLLRKLSFWLPPLIVLAFCGPWYLLAPAARHQDVAEFGGIYFGYYQVPSFFKDVWQCIGSLPAAFAAIAICYHPARSPERGYRWAAVVALLLGLLTFRCFVGAASEERHLVLGILPALSLASVGVSWLIQSSQTLRVRSHFTAALVIGSIAWLGLVNVYRIPKKTHRGFEELAEFLFSTGNARDSVILISADPTVESTMIAEIAMRERKRPDHTVLRASKEFASSDWMGRSYTLRYKTSAELLGQLEKLSVTLVVIDPVPRSQPEDQRLLLTVPVIFPDRFQLLREFPETSAPDAPVKNILVYRFKLGQTWTNLAPSPLKAKAEVRD